MASEATRTAQRTAQRCASSHGRVGVARLRSGVPGLGNGPFPEDRGVDNGGCFLQHIGINGLVEGKNDQGFFSHISWENPVVSCEDVPLVH